MKWTLLSLAILCLVLLAGSVAAQAQEGGYELSWWTVDGGGTTSSSGGSYTLSGTVGQHEAGKLYGGSYTLGGGFWGEEAAEYRIRTMYLPIIMSK